jgi:DNA-binding MarR family transcriptional regulator
MPRSVLQEELRKRGAFASAEQEACLNLLRTHDHVEAEFARLFQQHNLSAPQYNVLRILRGARDEQGAEEGLPCLEIAARMITRMPDITRLVDRLEAARPPLVERSRTAEDRRKVLVKITRAGLDLLARLDGPVLDLHARLLGHLSRAELAELNRLLVKARRAE